MTLQGPPNMTEGLGPQPRQANYTMNHDKLMENLLEDASSDLPSIECIAKDSRKYVLVQCSPAFFSSVVTPVILSLKAPFNAAADGALITLDEDPTPTLDKNGLIVYHTLKFNISTNTSPPTLLSRLSLHHYNTKRSLGVHGAGCMPDKRTAAVFFTESFLIPRLISRSKSTKFCDTTARALHHAIVKALGGPAPVPQPNSSAPTQRVCCECGEGKRLKTATPCLGCHQFVHGTKRCLGAHTCNPPVSVAPNLPLPSDPVLQSRKRPAALDTTGFRSPIFRDVRPNLGDIDSESEDSDAEYVPPPTSQLTLRPSRLIPPAAPQPSLSPRLTHPQSTPAIAAAHEPSPPPTFRQPQTSGQICLQAALSVPAQLVNGTQLQPFTPCQAGSAPSLPNAKPPKSSAPQGKRQAVKKGAPINLDSESFNAEMLHRELTFAQTRIASLEQSNKELTESNSIFSRRIQLFEKSENDRQFAQYFPPRATTPAPRATPAMAPPSTDPSVPPPSSATCPLSSEIMKELGIVRCELEDLQGKMSILLRSDKFTSVPPCSSSETASRPAWNPNEQPPAVAAFSPAPESVSSASTSEPSTITPAGPESFPPACEPLLSGSWPSPAPPSHTPTAFDPINHNSAPLGPDQPNQDSSSPQIGLPVDHIFDFLGPPQVNVLQADLNNPSRAAAPVLRATPKKMKNRMQQSQKASRTKPGWGLPFSRLPPPPPPASTYPRSAASARSTQPAPQQSQVYERRTSPTFLHSSSADLNQPRSQRWGAPPFSAPAPTKPHFASRQPQVYHRSTPLPAPPPAGPRDGRGQAPQQQRQVRRGRVSDQKKPVKVANLIDLN